MKNPGNAQYGSEIHKAMIKYAEAVAKEFEISEPAAFGQLIKLYEAMCNAADTEEKILNLIVGNKAAEVDKELGK